MAMAELVEVSLSSEIMGRDLQKPPNKNAEFHLVLPAPQRAPRAASSAWEERVAGGKRGDGPERRTTSAGRSVNSGSQENIESANK